MSELTTSHGSWPSAFRSLWWRGASSAASPPGRASSGGGPGRGRLMTDVGHADGSQPSVVSRLPNVRASRYHCADRLDCPHAASDGETTCMTQPTAAIGTSRKG